MNDSRMNGKEKVTKKEVRKVVYEKLATALAEYKGSLSEKKFRNKLKKATRLFAIDIAKASKQQVKDRTETRSEKSMPRASFSLQQDV